ncbi:twin-arginine translocase subunit TatC [Flavobacteriales bacterium]|jgi:sec-independent protein translocase protein TatC|nr:twin-arginine translocase subunit TatC [Flavobacteriales bacterium]MDB2362721.1 twin-arginine translocase subunit TatC [Flavobacteriales bacterium]
MRKIGEEKEHSFLDHLEILRWHLIRSAAAILVFTILAFIFPEFLFDKIILASKSPDFATYKFFCWLSETLHFGEALCIKEAPFELMNIKMSGQFSTHIVSSLVAGFVCAFPYVFWEIWRFIKPALHGSEKKYSRGVVFYTSLLFILGVLFGYYAVAPLSVQFLGNYQVSSQVVNQINLNSFISTVTTVCLANGIVFLLPILIYFLSKLGLISPEFLRQYRKHSLVILMILAAIITPPDIMSLILVTFPLMLLYELSIKVSAKFQDK